MTANFSLKVTSGKRTEIEVNCYPTSVNTKTFEFKDSKKTITDAKIAEWVNKALKEALEKFKTEA